MTEPTTPTGKRWWLDNTEFDWERDAILAIEREAAARILYDLGWPFDMYDAKWDSPEMRDAVAEVYEVQEGPCDPDCTWREAMDYELHKPEPGR